MPTDPQLFRGLFQSEAHRLPGSRTRRQRAVTLVETMIALGILAGCMLGFLGTFLQSRKTTETSVLHAAATNIVYGIIEQLKDHDYTTLLPNGSVDPADPDQTARKTVRVLINQNTIKWLTVKYTPYTAAYTTIVSGSPVVTPASVPKAPLTTPAPTAAAADVGGGAINNVIGPLPLSTASGTRSQSITVNLWIWIDEIPDLAKDVTDVKRITVVYTYNVNVGSSVRTIRNREVFIRTRYDK